MILAKTILLLAALVSPNQPIAVAVAVQPGAIKSRVAPFDPAMLRQALLRELAAAGIATGTSPDLPQLVVQVDAVDPGNRPALDQTATISVTSSFMQTGAPGRPASNVAIPPASCAARAKFGLLSTPGERARLALARCIDQLALHITENLTVTIGSVPAR
ncbi:hypothetical protein [Sandarakinorhabdus sp.]|uniref:hypothetical protein n=1 Tax=Sandarakinorhabdus sp. TaxID=1916663 RepID=UPI003340A3B5